MSRMCWPLNLAGEAQVASGREVLASSHLKRQRDVGVGEETWESWEKGQGATRPGLTWLQDSLQLSSSFHKCGNFAKSYTY